MPVYTYKCSSCNEAVEIFHSINYNQKEPCRKCGLELKKLFNTSAIIFKGKGFYRTDSRKSE